MFDDGAGAKGEPVDADGGLARRPRVPVDVVRPQQEVVGYAVVGPFAAVLEQAPVGLVRPQSTADHAGHVTGLAQTSVQDGHVDRLVVENGVVEVVPEQFIV